MDRDIVADEAGREHTGGLGERGGAGTTGGATTEPEITPGGGDDEDEPSMYEPSLEERQGLGDVGRYAQTDTADPADVGEREPNR